MKVKKRILYSFVIFAIVILLSLITVKYIQISSNNNTSAANKSLYELALNDLQSQSGSDRIIKIDKTNYSIRAGELFESGKQQAILAIKEDKNSNKIKLFLLENINGKWAKIDENSVNIDWPAIFLLIQDVTGDGLSDVLLKSWGAANANVGFNAWQLNNNKLESISGFDKLSQPKFDKTKNRIISYQSSAAGLVYTYGEYILKDSKLILVKEVTEDYTESGDSFVLKFYELRYNELALVKEQNLNRNQYYDVWDNVMKNM